MGETLISGKDPTISVVIPCFRAGELLAEAIESVLAQSPIYPAYLDDVNGVLRRYAV
ncbi:MAG: hypothetical protein ACYDBP_10520 [Leptospirales bacterium]